MPNNQYQDIYEKALKDAEKARTTFDKIQNKPVETKLMTWLNYQLATKDSNFKCAESCQKFLAKEEPSSFKTNLIDRLDKKFPDEGWKLFKDSENVILLQVCQRLLLKHKYEGYAGSLLELYENSQRSFDTSQSSLMLMCGNTYEDSPYSISHTTLGALTAQEYENLTSPEVVQKHNVVKYYEDVNKIILDAKKELSFIIHSPLRKTPEKPLTKKEAQNILDDLVLHKRITPEKTERAIQNLVTSREIKLEDAIAMLNHFIKKDHIDFHDRDHLVAKIENLKECDELSTIIPIINMVNKVKSISKEELAEIKNEITEKNKKNSKNTVSNEPPTELDELNNFLTKVMLNFSKKCFQNNEGTSHSTHQNNNQALTTYLAFNDVKNDQGLTEKLAKLIHYLNNISKGSKNDKKDSEFFCNTFLNVLHSLKVPEILSRHLPDANTSTITATTTKDTKTSFLSFSFSNKSSTISENLGELKQIISALTAIHSELTEDEKRISETALEDAASVSSGLSSLSG